MKTAVALLFAVFGLTAAARATPERAVEVDEHFAGSNKTEYAVLRTESDNLGNYYKYRRKTWLDEYAKDPSSKEPARSTLLLDVTYHLDPDHQDPNTRPAVTEDIHAQDTTLPWATVLQRYPEQAPARWTAAQMADISTHPAAGVNYKNRVSIVDGDQIRKAFGDKLGSRPWLLIDITEDSNSLYLRFGTEGGDEDRQYRLIRVSEPTTRAVRDCALLQPVYLVAGTYRTHDEAVQKARELRDIMREKKIYYFLPEVWSVANPRDQLDYVVADQFSTATIEAGRIPDLEKKLNIRLTPMSNRNFRNRTVVTR